MYTINEKQLEDYIANDPGCIWNDQAQLLGRQVSIPHGRIDLIIFYDVLYIVELKARPLQEKDVCQVLRYMRDVKDYFWTTHLSKYVNQICQN